MRGVVLAFVVVSCAVSSSFAASPDDKPLGPVRSQFYIFDGSSFEVGAKGPAVALMNPRKAARFERLVSLKKDLLAGMHSNVRERALR